MKKLYLIGLIVLIILVSLIIFLCVYIRQKSYLKLSLVYSDTKRNPLNNPMTNNGGYFTERDKNLSTQLIYSYKLNPQTVFFLGYSDNSYQDDDLTNLERNERTFFTKISYAWMP